MRRCCLYLNTQHIKAAAAIPPYFSFGMTFFVWHILVHTATSGQGPISNKYAGWWLLVALEMVLSYDKHDETDNGY